MSARRDTGRPQRRTEIEDRPTAPPAWRYALGAVVVVLVLGTGLVLGFGDFIGRPDGTAATPVRMSMAGFEPQMIHATAGEELTIELWTTDSALHLERGVHTLISDELGIYEELPAESRKTVTLQMPTEAGTYDIYCDTCCGGKASPSMHGRLHVAEA
jgi:cytochrome c oxidase subunit II